METELSDGGFIELALGGCIGLLHWVGCIGLLYWAVVLGWMKGIMMACMIA